ncbi:MAG: tRNA (adenosine(37)-N6)-threonylcarbamoyltransferase complex transferase subunit TsaD [bacterium]
MKILGIETSCDETAAAIVEIKGGKFKVLSNIISSQINIHRQFGGIVPEVAARNHIKNILPVIDEAIKTAKIKPADLALISVNTQPGLITSLIVGVETAKALAFSWQKPIVGVNHLEAHLSAVYLNNYKIKYPAIGLVVSGGHTQLFLMKDQYRFQVVGQTLDDAAGECFDKAAKILKLGYPGGPVISRLAKGGNPTAFKLPRPMLNKNNYDFSFSGLKTAVLYLVKDKKVNPPAGGKDVCASLEQAIVDVLIQKTIKAAGYYRVKTIILAGGVAANQQLRNQLAEAVENKLKGVDFQAPAIKFCTDNAAMTAVAGYFSARRRIKKQGADNLSKIKAQTD